MKESLATFARLTEFRPQRLDLLRQILQPLRFGPTPIMPFRVEMVILTEQAISALSTFVKTRTKKREELALDFSKSHLLNLLALCHATLNSLCEPSIALFCPVDRQVFSNDLVSS